MSLAVLQYQTRQLFALLKYSPDQPRVPAGQSGGGEFGSGGAGGATEQLSTHPKNMPEARTYGERVGASQLPEGHPDRVLAERVEGLGKEWTDSIVANDPRFAQLTEKEADLTYKLSRNEMLQNRVQQNIDKFWKERNETQTRFMRENTPPEEQEKYYAESNARYDQLSAKMDKYATRSGELYNERNDVNALASERIATWVKQGSAGGPVARPIVINSGFKDNEPTTQGQPVLLRENPVPHVVSFEHMVGGVPLGANDPQVGVKPLDGRAYYSPSERSIYIDPTTDGKAVVFHEMGHWYENTVPGGNAAARAYLNNRTANETAVPCTELAMKQYGNPGSYRPDEVAKPDKFSSYYTGKVYESGQTEITSMGMQRMAEDPARFYREDRSHFNFTLGMIRAGQRGGWWKEQ